MMIMAHIHYPEIITFGNSNKLYCNTGEWMHTYSYATLHKGNLSLWEYRPGQEPLQIKPQDVR
jgi:UDP-2,3-diacylglucosamine pyrophosphatase LpxH